MTKLLTSDVRTVQPSEWQAYRRLRLQALAESPDAFGSTFESEASRSDDEWKSRLTRAADGLDDLPLFAISAGHPVGLAWGKVSSEEPSLVHLYQMWVSPEFRGQGVGRALLVAVISWAREKSSSAIELGVTVTNTSAYNLYSGAGFKAHGEPEPLRVGSPLLAQSMRLPL
jgi:ribosomal protein S18 acetylase RimI-like enzyme